MVLAAVEAQATPRRRISGVVVVPPRRVRGTKTNHYYASDPLSIRWWDCCAAPVVAGEVEASALEDAKGISDAKMKLMARGWCHLPAEGGRIILPGAPPGRRNGPPPIPLL